MPTREILNSHPVQTLRKEISKTNIKGYSKLKKGDLVSLMLKHKDRFHHIKSATKKKKVDMPHSKDSKVKGFKSGDKVKIKRKTNTEKIRGTNTAKDLRASLKDYLRSYINANTKLKNEIKKSGASGGSGGKKGKNLIIPITNKSGFGIPSFTLELKDVVYGYNDRSDEASLIDSTPYIIPNDDTLKNMESAKRKKGGDNAYDNFRISYPTGSAVKTLGKNVVITI
jgi:hypothetical protein